jgi:hypothetical protein
MRSSFSLVSLLLLVSLAAVLSAWWMERYQRINAAVLLNETQTQLERHVGHLDISDPTKPHAVAIRPVVGAHMNWRWRVYLPPGKRYRAHYTDYDIPADGVIKSENNEPDRGYLSHEKEYSGEFIVDFAIFKDTAGQEEGWLSHLAIDDQGIIYGQFNDGKDFPKFDRTLSVLPKHGTRVFEQGVLLLHVKFDGDTKGVGMGQKVINGKVVSASRPGCVPGFAIWFEELVEEKAILDPGTE